MNQMETLKERIEEEREKLNRLALGDDLEATYRQSLAAWINTCFPLSRWSFTDLNKGVPSTY